LARIETAEHLEDFSRERTETISIDDEDDNTMSSFDGAHPAIQDTEGPISDRFSATRKSIQAKPKKGPRLSFEQKRREPFDMVSQNHSTLNTEADEPIERDHRAFYLENVAPLKLVCEENSSLACDTVEQVSTFLKTCLTEGLSRDVVVLFRSVRNRADERSN
jgi:hypothetical protein